MECLSSAKQSLFRFEFLQEFSSSDEFSYFQEYKATGKVEVHSLMQGWWDFIESKRDEGVTLQRVRLVREPLTDYVRWELEIHKQSSDYGDNICVLKEEKINSILKELGDFWIIDDHTVLKMQYSAQGQYEGFSVLPDAEKATTAKTYLIEQSTPLSRR